MNKYLKPIVFLLAVSQSITIQASNVFKQFKVYTADVEVYDHTDSSLKLESKSSKYQIKLEPNMEGNIMFTLGRYGYRTTLNNLKDLSFGVKIEGFRNGHVVNPVYNTDASNENVVIDGNCMMFQWINEPLPVYFQSEVDSVKLQFSNSHLLNVHQYLALDDLTILPSKDVDENPFLLDCQKNSIMFGIEGTSNTEKSDRKTIARQLLAYFKSTESVQDSNTLCIMEFGKEVHSMSESQAKKDMAHSIKSYKKGKVAPKPKSKHSNWEAAFDKAIERKPDIFIFITEHWSNYSNDGMTSINAQYQSLIEKCNTLKNNGTRLLFITSGLSRNETSNQTLYSLLNEQATNEIFGTDLTLDSNLRDVDLISMDDFNAFQYVNLSSLLHCDKIDHTEDMAEYSHLLDLNENALVKQKK